MDTNKHTLPPDFEEKVRKAIDGLRYYRVYNASWDGYDKAAEEAREMAGKLEDKRMRAKALSDVLYYDSWHDEKLADDALKAAEEAGNAEVICSLLVDKLFEIRDNKEAIKFIDEVAIPKMEALSGDSGKGVFLFWRGSKCFRLEDSDGAYADFKKAAALIDKSDNYRACALSGMKALEYSRANAESPCNGVQITAETLINDGGRLLFASQPGFGWGSSVLYRLHEYDSLSYYISRASRIMFDTNMKVGEKSASNDGKNVLEVISYGERAEVKAGAFEDCMHTRLTVTGEYIADAYFAPGVGLVKAVFTHSGDKEEIYELSEYDIKGGSGYMPMCVGNRLSYINTKLPDYIYQKYESEIDWVDGNAAHYSVVSIVTPKKNYLKDYDIDSEMYVAEAEKACDNWDVKGAIEYLKKAVVANTAAEPSLAADGGIAYLTHFGAVHEKKYRICPSSYNLSTLTLCEKGVKYDESVYSFGPYKFGTRHEENRIFGAKPFRYLQALAGCIFNEEEWKDGYTKRFVNDEWNRDVEIFLSVESVGKVTTRKEEFDDCLKVTLEAELAESGTDYYFKDNFRYVYCGKKEFYFAKGIGIVKFDFTWGTSLSSSSELISYSLPEADKERYFPVGFGNRWEYEEKNLAAENYTAKRIVDTAASNGTKFFIHDTQEFWYNGTEEEYNAFKESLK